MNNKEAYDVWSENYDEIENKTRDLEAVALRRSVSALDWSDVLEIGCGTGKNTVWLAERAKRLVGADFSAEMLAKAREKISAENVEFKQFDLRKHWEFSENEFDLITCSLALEHIEDIDFIFRQAGKTLRAGGFFYIGELHPFKQYDGGKARFEIESKMFELECFTHPVSEFFAAAKDNNFETVDLNEWFDDENKRTPPRILSMIFKLKNRLIG